MVRTLEITRATTNEQNKIYMTNAGIRREQIMLFGGQPAGKVAKKALHVYPLLTLATACPTAKLAPHSRQNAQFIM